MSRDPTESTVTDDLPADQTTQDTSEAGSTDGDEAGDDRAVEDVDEEILRSIIGERAYQGLYSESEAKELAPVHALTGERTVDVASPEQAQEFASEVGESQEKPYVAQLVSTETMAETGSMPFSACVFHHFSLVGGMAYHEAYSAVWESPAFDVEVDPDYESGILTITVEGPAGTN